ncbi:MAG: aminopeptidase P family protein [Clostridia bacterium]|nr:aminopeptidase P family protein [Clostridia bacterium]
MGIIKTKEEIEKLRKAALLGDRCFEHICKFIKPGMTEIQIAKEIDDFFVKNGASGSSFDTIVGAGKNSAQIHSTPTEYVIQNQDIILLDFGCVLDGYCSDMSRTIFVGSPTDKQKEVYKLVQDAHYNATKKIRIKDVAKKADEYGRKNIQEAGYDYAHALGHGVGVEVHEKPLISYRSEEILEEDMVFTIEPGIYIENEFGVRIEDTGVLMQNGVELFSKSSREIIIL